MLENIQSTWTLPLEQALKAGNSQASQFATLDIVTTQPSADGVINLSAAGTQYGPSRIRLLPYCEGATGSNFSMRLYGWAMNSNPMNSSWTLWFPVLLAELVCTSCNLGGQSSMALKETEKVCDTIALVQGSLGATGQIYSTGPGTNLTACAVIELAGLHHLQFDFQQVDPVSMNCYWSRV